MLSWLKKIWLICFTGKPFKIVPFKHILPVTIGQRVDIPETVTAILYTEQGEINAYPRKPLSLNKDLIQRQNGGRQRFLLTGTFRSPDRYIYSLQNGSISGAFGLVYDAQSRSFIAESAQEWTIDLTDSHYTRLINYPQKTTLPGITFSFLTNGADGGFYHFLFESLVKLHLYNSIIQGAAQLLFNGPATTWKLKWLHKAGVDTGKIVWVTNPVHLGCDQLIFSNALVGDQQLNAWCIDALKKMFKVDTPPQITAGKRRILWISRKGAALREIIWEDEIIAMFPAMERVDLGKLTAEETIEKFETATHVTGPHGAGFSNIFLCAPGTKILEIHPDNTPFQPCYQRLATVCSLSHAAMYLDFTNPQNNETGLPAFAAIWPEFIC